ncbi:MAG: PPOX class F420-dependent oxidoreductase [Chloroflexota bacterium]
MATTLTDSMRTYLAEPRFAVLATLNNDGLPHQTVVWYDVRGHEILFNTARGRVKDKNMRRDARVSLCIEDGYRYLTLQGRVRIEDDPATTQSDIRSLAIRYAGPEHGEEQARNQFFREQRVSLYLQIEHIIANGV